MMPALRCPVEEQHQQLMLRRTNKRYYRCRCYCYSRTPEVGRNGNAVRLNSEHPRLHALLCKRLTFCDPIHRQTSPLAAPRQRPPTSLIHASSTSINYKSSIYYTGGTLASVISVAKISTRPDAILESPAGGHARNRDTRPFLLILPESPESQVFISFIEDIINLRKHLIESVYIRASHILMVVISRVPGNDIDLGYRRSNTLGSPPTLVTKSWHWCFRGPPILPLESPAESIEEACD